MESDFLHNHAQFPDLLRIVGDKHAIDPVLIEKDYWIMHCLYGLQQLGLRFELKGGTSLSKGYKIIDRFSEDIDIRIDPPEDQSVSTERNQNKANQIESRKKFYDWLANTIKIDGISSVERDLSFDDEKYRSGGIRLIYKELNGTNRDLKQGVLLEVGFDDVTPNLAMDISSWAYDHAVEKEVAILDNRAKSVPCYNPGHTLVEKLQAISTKFGKQQASGDFPTNFMRHYYDVYCLLDEPTVTDFIGTADYLAHKERRFRSENKDITTNEAFRLSSKETFEQYKSAYDKMEALYYRDRPTFDEIIERIKAYAEKL